jgi:hypothetical protein
MSKIIYTPLGYSLLRIYSRYDRGGGEVMPIVLHESTTWGLMPFWFFFQAKIREGSKKEFGPEDSQNENEFA